MLHAEIYLPRHSVKQTKVSYIARTLPKNITCQGGGGGGGASQGLVQLAPLPFFCLIHLQLATGMWL